jgi:hypothetical protein
MKKSPQKILKEKKTKKKRRGEGQHGRIQV